MRFSVVGSLICAAGLVLFTMLTGGAAAVDPQDVQDQAAAPAGELAGAATIGQVLRPHAPRVKAIQVRWTISDDFRVEPAGRVWLHLRSSPDDSGDLATASVPVKDLENNGFSSFELPALPATPSQSLYFIVDVSSVNITQGILSLWASSADVYPDGAMYLNGRATDRDLVFRVVYEPDLRLLLAALLEMLAEYGSAILAALFLVLLPAGALYSLWGKGIARGPGVLSLIGASPALLSAVSVLQLAVPIPAGWVVIGAAAGVILLRAIHKVHRVNERETCSGIRPAGVEALAGYVASPSMEPAKASTPKFPTTSSETALGDRRSPENGFLRLSSLKRIPTSTYALAGFTALAFAVALLQIRDVPAPLWVDSFAHAANIQQLIADGRLTTTIFYHFGFHAFVALVAQLMDVTIPRAMLPIGQLFVVQIGLSVLVLTRRLCGDNAAGLAGAVCVWFLSPTPSYFVTWGRYPLLLGASILPVALYFLIELMEQPRFDRRLFLLAIVTFAGLSFAHVRLILFYGAFAAVLLISMRWRGSSGNGTLGRVGVLAWAGFVFGFVWLALFLLRGASGQTLFAQNMAAAPPGPLVAIDVSMSHHGPTVWLLALLGTVVGVLRRSRVVFLMLGWYGALMLFAFLPLHSFGGEYLSPGLVILMAFLPAALVIGDFAQWGIARLRPEGPTVKGAAIAADPRMGTQARNSFRELAPFALFGPTRQTQLHTAIWSAAFAMVALIGARDMVSIVNPTTVLYTEADETAMAWIQAQTPKDARFLVNSFHWTGSTYVPSDGGAWIPYVAARPIEYWTPTNAPGPAPLIEGRKIAFIYLGRRGGVLSHSQFACQPERYALVYRQDGIEIYQVRGTGEPLAPIVPISVDCGAKG